MGNKKGQSGKGAGQGAGAVAGKHAGLDSGRILLGLRCNITTWDWLRGYC